MAISSTLNEALLGAVSTGKLLESSAANIRALLEQGDSPLAQSSVQELIEREEWAELNDRFFKTLSFGTGGLRGRTIGKVVTQAEQGTPQELGRPEHACVGTNAMNDYNISRATQGLVAYLRAWFRQEGLPGRPKIAIAHDSRHFSRYFAELTARVAKENGADVVLFSGPRSTPELSFAVRYTRSSAGIVITASHNPPHDNGYKVYFNDGAQVIDPHASGIIAQVNGLESDQYTPLPADEQGSIESVDVEIDNPYLDRLETLFLDRSLAGNGLKVVYTPIHGTGVVIIPTILERFGFKASIVPEQAEFDGRFPTVKSPNPENADALALAIALADKEDADLVIATDPDDDRVGVAIRNRKGEMELLSGNQIGSLMAWYRVATLLRQGVLTEENRHRGVIIKTLVTTDLQKAIAQKHGMHCVETLTGFKYIGEKLGKYEHAIPEALRENYRDLSEAETRKLRLEHSHFYVFGGEESYGYSGADFTRDKDGNGSALMFTEVAAYAKSEGITLDVLLDRIYAEYGYFAERSHSLTFEGAEGAAKIQRISASFAAEPPKEYDGVAITGITNFATDVVLDSEGDRIPREAMLMMELADGRRAAIRPSGTEPKIKLYLFARRELPAGVSEAELATVKEETGASLDRLWQEYQKDVERRLA